MDDRTARVSALVETYGLASGWEVRLGPEVGEPTEVVDALQRVGAAVDPDGAVSAAVSGGELVGWLEQNPDAIVAFAQDPRGAVAARDAGLPGPAVVTVGAPTPTIGVMTVQVGPEDGVERARAELAAWALGSADHLRALLADRPDVGSPGVDANERPPRGSVREARRLVSVVATSTRRWIRQANRARRGRG